MTANYRQHDANRDTEQEQQTDDDAEDVAREQWVSSFKEGFKAGCSERRADPSNRHGELADAKPAAEFEVAEAAQAGYELGLNKGFPGAQIDVEKKANAAFDRSDHSAGLSDWS